MVCPCCVTVGCSCGGPGLSAAPRSAVVSISVGDFAGQDPVCDPVDFKSFVDGTYILAAVSPQVFSDLVVYEVTTTSGINLRLDWYCSSGSFGQVVDINLQYCNLRVQCFRRILMRVATIDNEVPSLCSLTQGSATTYTLTNRNISYDFPFRCDSTTSSVKNYDVTVTVAPSW